MTRTVLFLLIGILLFFTGCSKDQESKDSHQPHITVTAVDPQSVPEITALGDSVAKTLLKTLKGELIQTIKQSGPVEAIKVCNTKALPLTRQVAQQFGANIAIKRTSFKIRNPKNKPDSLEVQALRYFDNALKSGKPLPAHFVQKIEEDGQTRFRYYMPLRVASLCVNCHGDPNHMPEPLKEALHRLYPNDRAVGYKAGDFRGVIRVEISPENS